MVPNTFIVDIIIRTGDTYNVKISVTIALFFNEQKYLKMGSLISPHALGTVSWVKAFHFCFSSDPHVMDAFQPLSLLAVASSAADPVDLFSQINYLFKKLCLFSEPNASCLYIICHTHTNVPLL